MLLSARERILTIRLLNKLAIHPDYAKVLGIESVQDRSGPEEIEEHPRESFLQNGG